MKDLFFFNFLKCTMNKTLYREQNGGVFFYPRVIKEACNNQHNCTFINKTIT